MASEPLGAKECREKGKSMRVSALRIADALIAASGTAPNPTTIDDMATCLSHGNGALRVEGTRVIWLVFGSLALAGNQEASHPPIVRARLRVTPRTGALLGSGEVAGDFREVAGSGIGRPHQDYPAGYRRTWAPYPTKSDYPVPMGGVVPAITVANTIDVIVEGNEFNWVNLDSQEHFPVGCLVYRRKANGSVVAYQRIAPLKWLLVSLQSAACPVDLAALRSELKFDSIDPSHLDHRRPVLFDVSG